jgi:hypothetical protein
MWNETRFEQHLKDRLTAEFGQEKSLSMFARFAAARDKVLDEIRQIAAVEPNLSDHGPDHIANVFEYVLSLISPDQTTHRLSAIDLYILAMVILFHDTGNLHGREDHELNIDKIFDWARGTAADTRREKTLVLTAVRAHTGKAAAGSRNTIGDVAFDDHINGRQVQLRSIAALLRFADELAEGPQRTSDFFRTHIGFDEKSEIYHRYASCTNVSADRGSERIRLTYEIQIEEFSSDKAGVQLTSMTQFLTFVFQRIAKLDEERRYARFYCPALAAFKQTDVAINFYSGSALMPHTVCFQLDDLVVPGEAAIPLNDRFQGKCDTPEAIAAEVLATIK